MLATRRVGFGPYSRGGSHDGRRATDNGGREYAELVWRCGTPRAWRLWSLASIEGASAVPASRLPQVWEADGLQGPLLHGLYRNHRGDARRLLMAWATPTSRSGKTSTCSRR